MTPLWVPLVVAVIAVIGTLAGVVFTQTWNSRQEELRWARENDRLREDRAREDEDRAREDKNRTYEHRRTAYVEFQQELGHLMQLLFASRTSGQLVAGKDANELSYRWEPIRIYGTRKASDLAYACMDKIGDWRRHLDDWDLADDVFIAAGNYLGQIRKELGVPDWEDVPDWSGVTEWEPAESPEPSQRPSHERDQGRAG